jgi:hypothetical protein
LKLLDIFVSQTFWKVEINVKWIHAVLHF